MDVKLVVHSEGEPVVQLTKTMRIVQTAYTALQQSPEMNRAKITHIKESIRKGTYCIDPNEIAKKIVQLESLSTI
jgi:flagellar biosynthesis anti-sigma factor FlgM